MITSLGILGGLILVIGAAWPVHKVSHPIKSTKNWLYAIGAVILTIFAYLDYKYNGAPFFFVILELYIIFASVLMFSDTDDRIDTALLSLGGLGMIVWSLYLFEDSTTIIFILGLCGIGIGYALDTGTRKRNTVLFFASLLLTIFSYLSGAWVFFWLNAFFALFSGYHALKLKNENKALRN